MSLELHRDIADAVRSALTDADGVPNSRERIAVFTRRAADLLKADNAAFSYDWFFGACGLDNWGEPMPDRRVVR